MRLTMRSTTRRGARRGVALLGTAVMATTVLAGCGSDSDDSRDSGDSGDSGDSSSFVDQDAQAIMDAAEEATKNASSFRIVGEMQSDGSEASLDLVLATDGCEGTVGIDGSDVEVLKIGDEGWYRPTADFWRAQLGGAGMDDATLDQLLTQVEGKWITDEEGSFDDFCTIESFFDDADDADDDDDNSEASKGDVEDIDGVEAIAIDHESDGTPATLWVAVDEPHYAVRVDGGDEGSFDLTDFDEEVSFEAPADSDVVDLNSLMG